MPRDLGGQKWACVRCIAGHRATLCDHFSGWLVPVRAAGRPAKRCTHADTTHCDCEGLRMILMVPIPNAEPCNCHPDKHECLRGEQFFITRVENRNVTPHISATLQAQHAALSEANRILGGSARLIHMRLADHLSANNAQATATYNVPLANGPIIALPIETSPTIPSTTGSLSTGASIKGISSTGTSPPDASLIDLVPTETSPTNSPSFASVRNDDTAGYLWPDLLDVFAEGNGRGRAGPISKPL